MMKIVSFYLLSVLCSLPAVSYAQYAPQAGVTGSDAVAAGSAQVTGWATHCRLWRGYQDIAQPSSGYASLGDSTAAIGPSDNFIVSLGDSGVALLTFAHPVIDGPGPDFAVFENGFADPADPEQAFLELAFVEVSSDGLSFFRFPSASFTQTDTQIAAAGVYMNARKLNNLAGKYIGNYGTPFDLQELSGIAGLDIDHVTHIRIVDAIGSLHGHSAYDASGRVINDPYPTPFPSGGFDLDAVGVIHQDAGTGIDEPAKKIVSFYPNPANDRLIIKVKEPVTVLLTDVTGKVLRRVQVNNESVLFLDDLAGGVYLLNFINAGGLKWAERISKL